MASRITMSVGRCYSQPHGGYEFCLYRGEKLIARQHGHRSSAAARRAGIAAAAKFVEA